LIALIEDFERQQVACIDGDNDGYYANRPDCPLGPDCDDSDFDVNPVVAEVCSDGIDNNCNGQIDEDCAQPDRFTDRGDGSIRDNDSGLIWLKKADCFGSMPWGEAMASASNLTCGQCGLTDCSANGQWRLPTKEEWEAFYYPDCGIAGWACLRDLVGTGWWNQDQAAGRGFIGVLNSANLYGYYWSSNDYYSESGLTHIGWAAEMEYGSMRTFNADYGGPHVWPVRSGN
jgi:hypothetical protein